MSKEEDRKKLLITFHLSIARQKTAYEVLMQEKNNTGLSPSFIIHEALELYGQYLQQKTCFSKVVSVPLDAEPTKIEIVPTKVEEKAMEIEEIVSADAVVEEEVQLHQKMQEQEEDMLEELDIDDPYLMSIIGQSYPEED